MLPRPFRMMDHEAQRAWADMLAAPALTDPDEATSLMALNRLEIMTARPAMLRKLAETFPEEWAIQQFDHHMFETSWVDANAAHENGDLHRVPDLLVQAAIFEADRGELSTAIELIVWAFLFRLAVVPRKFSPEIELLPDRRIT